MFKTLKTTAQSLLTVLENQAASNRALTEALNCQSETFGALAAKLDGVSTVLNGIADSLKAIRTASEYTASATRHDRHTAGKTTL